MTLLSVNVNEHTEKKGGLTYLSWAWAWAEVLKVDAAATWVCHTYGVPGQEQPVMWIGDTALVHVSVTVNGLRRECMLPVMDHRNVAVKQPDARKVSDTIMRCMVKAIAMHGLGLYIYAGEDLPQALSPEDEAKAKREDELQSLALDMIELAQQGKELEAIRAWYDPQSFSADHETGQEERLFVWGLLKNESKLRAAIKANKPAPVEA